MRKIKIDWDSLLLMYESSSMEFESQNYLDMSTGDVISADLEDEDEDAHEYDEDNLLPMPSSSSHDDYEAMEAFIDTIGNSKIRDRLSNAISGKGAFRRFKDTLYDYPDEQKRWYQYLEKRHVNELITWLEEYDLEPESLPASMALADNVIYLPNAVEQQTENSPYITDPKEVMRLGEQKLDENYEFRAYLKGYLKWSNKRLDKAVYDILEDVKKHIDCSKCCNCCIESTAGMEKDEIQAAAKKLQMTIDEFSEKYLTKNEFGEVIANGPPCPFFQEMNCILGDSKPDSCKLFPYLEDEDFRTRLLGVVTNATYCPIVYNVLEQLKVEVGWRRNKGRR